LTSALPVPVVPSAARKALRAFAAACAILCTFAADGPVVFPPVVVFPLAVVVFPPVVVFPLAVVACPPVVVFPLAAVVFPVDVTFVGVVFPALLVFPTVGVVTAIVAPPRAVTTLSTTSSFQV